MGINYKENGEQIPLLLDLPSEEMTNIGLCYFPQSLPEADRLFDILSNTLPFKQNFIKMYGKIHPVPRLEAWFADRPYVYSGVIQHPLSWTPEMANLLQFAIEFSGIEFNSALVNLYRNGADWVSYHQDDEDLFGQDPTIMSLSLGATRKFSLRKLPLKKEKFSLALYHGDILLMNGHCQRNWQHQIDKAPVHIGPRLNITFRKII